jgi:predicted metal-dependent phosphoesterase TrpH
VSSRADFHTHSNCSDGLLSPTALVELAVSRGVRIMALTDHDSTEGLPEALQAGSRYPGFTLIPGVEMSTDIPGSEVHVLGYFLDPQDGQLQEELAHLRTLRRDRGRRMVEKLRDLGMDISWERVQAIADGGAVGRPHVAQAMLEKGYIGSTQEAFDRYISRNGPAYVERAKMTPAEAVAFLHQRRALPVLAHPREMEDLEDLLPPLQKAGLVGIEVYYQDYDEASIERLLTVARRHGLLPTGGSDYHGLGGERERLPGDIPLPDEVIDAFMAMGERYVTDRT